MKSLLVLLLFAIISVVHSYKILIMFPVPAKSHYILGAALGKGLAAAGHEITMVSAFEEKNIPKNYRNVHLKFPEIRKDKSKFNPFDMETMHPWKGIYKMNSNGHQLSKDVFEHAEFKKLLNEKFDLIMVQQFKNDAMKVIQCHFKVPMIIVNTLGPNAWINQWVANPSPPSYVPDLFLSYASDMNLWQRTFNTLTHMVEYLNNEMFIRTQTEIAKKYFPECKDVEGAMNNISLVLLNSHESVNQPVPLVPNMIQIGGYHIKPAKELPKDLKEFMDNAKEGVVYFSMGSNIDFTDIADNIKSAITKSLGKLKQKVLWKYDADTFPGKPDNVQLGAWFPQADILAHPNCKLFITHGGLLSTLETVYHGVPVLTFPVFGDQKMNAAKAEMAGYGLKLLFKDITEERVDEALNKLLNDPKYKKNAQKRSKLIKDQPLKPLDAAVYWTEYVARHGGAPHLMVQGVKLPWYQYVLLDVYAILTLGVGFVFAVFYVAIKKLCCSGDKKDKKKKD